MVAPVVEGKTIAEIDEATDNGELRVDPETARAAAEDLQNEGVNTAADLARARSTPSGFCLRNGLLPQHPMTVTAVLSVISLSTCLSARNLAETDHVGLKIGSRLDLNLIIKNLPETSAMIVRPY